MRSALYAGSIVHARRDNHAQRTFRYPVFMASLDLDELPDLDRELRLFSHRRFNLFGFDERDYEGQLDLASLRAANGIAVPHHSRLVTNLRVLGYVFNPVSFALDYDQRGELASVIAEVNNTYGGRRRYVFGNHRDHVRELFVSPFLHGDAVYRLDVIAPLDGPRLAITMHVDMLPDRAKPQRVFTAHFAGERRELSDRTLAATAVRYPLMTAQVIGLIHLEAWRLRRLGVPYRRPEPDHRPISGPPSLVSRPT